VWYFAPIPSAKDKVRVTKTFSYIQKNGTKLPQKYFYKLHQNTTTSVLTQVAVNQTQSVRIRRKDKPEIHLQRRPAGADQLRELQTDEVGDLQPGESIEVSVTISETRQISDDDSYSPKHPVVGSTLVTVYVEGGLALTASAYCKSEALEERTDHAPPRVYAWQMHSGILPFQGIMVSWSPMNVMEDAAAVAPTERIGAPTNGEMQPVSGEQIIVTPPPTAEPS
jgi:hypothetical protein